MTHLLDTSALLAHYLGEPGAERVQVRVKTAGTRIKRWSSKPGLIDYRGSSGDSPKETSERFRILGCTRMPCASKAR